MWRGPWSSSHRSLGLEIRIKSSDILGEGKIGYLDPCSLQGVTFWFPPMSGSHQKSTFILILLPFFINHSKMFVIPHFTPLIDLSFSDINLTFTYFWEIFSNMEICFTSLVTHSNVDIVRKINKFVWNVYIISKVLIRIDSTDSKALKTVL